MYPKVSIIIPFYNCQYVDQAINSALNQTYPNIEIIVVDDGSTIYTEKITPFLGKITYLKKENGGTATALNYGIRSATGEYIAWLSSDDYFLPHKISRQISFMLNRNAEASFTNYDIIDKNNKVIIPWACYRISDLKQIYKAFLTFNINPVNGCTVVMKKDLFDRIGYFNPYHRYTHDYEMWLRLLVKGHQLHFLDEVLVKFRQHEESGTNKFQLKMRKELAEIEMYYRPLLLKYIELL
ncbi:glycosyltransferase [Neobacillus sp. 179-C4.2 HS]|uniref:Glycosyltransferase n=1 Tax=Neobacillus driksii TaxID=3035913 RepID=A0ABV4YSH0_9BACI|nr:glycosyltransferase [Neobacillus sp. 179.-C4.2 HS]MDP5194106.1 glycosyltransferase [Neobacillus sp. 179.-C4.2 HS]